MKNKKCSKKIYGFTLVELVITIAIVIILSVVSVPIYRSHTDKAKMAEGYALLGLILSAQKAYYSEYGNFLHCYQGSNIPEHWGSKDEVLGIDARGNKYFSFFCLNGAESTGTSTLETLDYFFMAHVRKPNDLRKSNKDLNISLEYNITLGGKFVDYPINYDSSWR